MNSLLKRANADAKYVDLVVSFASVDGADVTAPTVRFHFSEEGAKQS